MRIEQVDADVVVWAPAKVNLFLEVLAKRADGYHEIATLMTAVSLYDTLEFKEEASGEVQLRCDHPNLSTGPDNLICRAAQLLRQRHGCTQGPIGLVEVGEVAEIDSHCIGEKDPEPHGQQRSWQGAEETLLHVGCQVIEQLH